MSVIIRSLSRVGTPVKGLKSYGHGFRITSTCALAAAALLASGARAEKPAPHTSPESRVVRTVTPTGRETALLARAMALLAATRSGRPVADFLRESGIAVHWSAQPYGTHGSFGIREDGSAVILLGRPEARLAEEEAAAGLALLLAHEGTHARQRLQWKLPACLEEELEAFLKEIAVQHEILMRPDLPHPPADMRLRYSLVRLDDGVERQLAVVREAYVARARAMLEEAVSGFSPPERPARREALRREWGEAGVLDGYRGLDDLLREAEGPERKRMLAEALARWRVLLAEFKAEAARWPLPPSP